MVATFLRLTKADIFEEKKKLASLFKSRCYVCHKKFGKGFSFHHKWYSGNEPDHRSSDYYLFVFAQIKKDPKQFLLVCKPHHYFVGWGASIKNRTMWNRYLKAVRMSR